MEIGENDLSKRVEAIELAVDDLQAAFSEFKGTLKPIECCGCVIEISWDLEGKFSGFLLELLDDCKPLNDKKKGDVAELSGIENLEKVVMTAYQHGIRLCLKWIREKERFEFVGMGLKGKDRPCKT